MYPLFAISNQRHANNLLRTFSFFQLAVIHLFELLLPNLFAQQNNPIQFSQLFLVILLRFLLLTASAALPMSRHLSDVGERVADA